MTTSEITKEEPWDRLAPLATTDEGMRSDISSLLKFQDDPNSLNPLYLFWTLYQPEVTDSEGNVSPARELSGRDKEAVLESLEVLYKRYHVAYEPDADDSAVKRFLMSYVAGNAPDSLPFPEALKNALIYIHVAAARAFMLNCTAGFSDETRSCLSEVKWTFDRLRRAGFEPKYSIDPMREEGNLEGISIFLSTLAVTAITFVELSRINSVDGRYAEALHYLAQAGDLYENALPTPMGVWEAWPLGLGWQESPTRFGVHSEDYLTNGLSISVSELTETFERLKLSSSSVNRWTPIVNDCRTLANHSSCWRFYEYEEALLKEWCKQDGIHELLYMHIERVGIRDEDGVITTWGEFWHDAKGWASAQLSRSEYRKMRDEDEKDAAKKRLRNYFFGDDWLRVPQRAQKALITADKEFNSKEEGRIEAIFNELRIATEEMCNLYIWWPLENLKSSEWFPEMDVFEQRRQEKDHNSHDPNLIGLIWPCEQQFYGKFLAQRKLTSIETQFLTRDLPKVSKKLWYTRRNLAEHELDKMAQRDAVEEFFNRFLGIGQPGILPELARIGRKLQSPGK